MSASTRNYSVTFLDFGNGSNSGYDKSSPKTINLTASNSNGSSTTTQLISLCQCVDYVKATALANTTDYVGNALEMGDYLLKHHWHMVPNPEVGAIMVFQPGSYDVPNGGFGHVGIINSAELHGPKWNVTLQNANWYAGEQSRDSGCDNVSFRGITGIPNSTQTPQLSDPVTYFVRD